MIDYEKLYHIMVDASEKAIEAIDNQNYGLAKQLLIHAEQKAEDRYIEADDSDDHDNTICRKGRS